MRYNCIIERLFKGFPSLRFGLEHPFLYGPIINLLYNPTEFSDGHLLLIDISINNTITLAVVQTHDAFGLSEIYSLTSFVNR